MQRLLAELKKIIISTTLAIAEVHFLCECAVSAPNRKTRSDIKYISNVKMSLKQAREETQVYLVFKTIDTQEFYFTTFSFFHMYGMESIRNSPILEVQPS